MIGYRYGDLVSEPRRPDFQDFLAAAHSQQGRPLCLCAPGGIAMYVARANGRFVIKRMPNSGNHHETHCDSYEPPAELSGLGQVNGSAIQENADEGVTTLRFAFGLTKGKGRKAPMAGETEADSVKAETSKLSLRAALHYLWEEAGLNRWSPKMAGKRNWYVVRKHLLQASGGKFAKGLALGEVLFIPEPFSLDRKQEIAQRRYAQVMRGAAERAGVRPLMLVIAEVKEIGTARFGFKAVVKHAPDFPFILTEDLHRLLAKRFETELGLWSAVDDSHLVLIATFGIGATGLAMIEEASLMVTNSSWIPLESGHDHLLLEDLIGAQRRFTRGLRYNLPLARPLACAVLSDTGEVGTALYIVPAASTDDYEKAVGELAYSSTLAAWVWKVGVGERPLLPPAAVYRPSMVNSPPRNRSA